MKLLTKQNLKDLPALGSQDGLGKEAVAQVKFFTPDSNWTWYATEFEPETGTFFGLVQGDEDELGYFNLHELESVRGRLNLPVERDRYFTPTKLNEIRS